MKKSKQLYYVLVSAKHLGKLKAGDNYSGKEPLHICTSKKEALDKAKLIFAFGYHCEVWEVIAKTYPYLYIDHATDKVTLKRKVKKL